jgi:hypothetical protein
VFFGIFVSCYRIVSACFAQSVIDLRFCVVCNFEVDIVALFRLEIRHTLIKYSIEIATPPKFGDSLYISCLFVLMCLVVASCLSLWLSSSSWSVKIIEIHTFVIFVRDRHVLTSRVNNTKKSFEITAIGCREAFVLRGNSQLLLKIRWESPPGFLLVHRLKRERCFLYLCFYCQQ